MKKGTMLIVLCVAIATMCMIGLGAEKRSETEKKQLDYTSRVPKYTFADTLEEQEAQLKTNPMIQRFIESRKKMAGDPYRPIYHYVNPEGSLNDPNGLCFWKGRWHLFYQAYPPEDPRQHWGHAVSDDLIHWRDLPYAIYPNPEKACFSGTTLAEEDRVIALYNGTMAGNMVAISSDPLLLNWEKLTGNPVLPLKSPDGSHAPYRGLDPCIFKKGGMYYSLQGGVLPGPGSMPLRANFLLRSKDLVKWEYLHPFVEKDHFSLVGDDGSCPYFWPIGDRHILLYFSHMSGGKYLLGDYAKERDKFVVTGGGDFNFGPYAPAGVHAPSAAPDGKDGVIVIFNMNSGKRTEGWNGIMTLPRRLTLCAKDLLEIEPAGDIESLRYDHQHIDAMTLPANQEVVLENVRGNAMEIIAEIDPKNAPMVEMNVLRSPGKEETTRIMFFENRGYGRGGWPEFRNWDLITIDSSYSSLLPGVLSRSPETAQVFIENNEPLKLRVFIDRSIIEVFVNGKQCVTVRVYPGRKDSIGVSLRSQGQDAVLKSLDAWQMKNIYSQTTSVSSANEDTVTETWGQIIEAPPETFFAADVSDNVRNGLTNTLLAATAEWGNYGPLEYWVLGTDEKAAKDLTELFCERRSQLGQYEKSECLSHHTDTNSKHNFESYRKIGADAIANEKPGGSMGWNGNREWGIHLYTSSYPLGFDKLFGSSPGGAQKGVFHEYFHAVQQAHMFTRDKDERNALSGPTWFIEGGAEYMAQTTVRKLWASGKLAIIDNSGLSSLEQSFENKMKKGKNTIENNCPGIKLGDITYDNDCSSAAYDLGAWAVGYLLNKVGQTALLDTFYPSLNELGWEGAFQKTFGMSSEDFYAEFNLFLEKPLADQLAILPKYD